MGIIFDTSTSKKSHMSKYLFIIITGIFFIVTSCNNENNTVLRPSVTGKAGEVLVVMDKQLWESEAGDSLKKILLQEYPGLPVAEPLFDVINIPPQAFTDMFKTHRNVIMIETGEKQKNGINITKDVWAETQLLISISAKNTNEIIKIINQNKDKIISVIENTELGRISDNYKKYPERETIEILKQKHNISLVIPAGYSLDREAGNFLWIAHETPRISQGILIYYYNYSDTNTFTSDYLIGKRDYFLKKYVPGPSEGSYMTTGLEVYPLFDELSLNGEYATRLRGLWEVENDFMGGPFISITTLDKKRNRVITAEGFVYAPQFNKRNYMRQLEAILYTLKIVD